MSSSPSELVFVVSLEIERKFLVSKPPDLLERCRSDQIEQGYLAIGEDGSEVRLRKIGKEAVLTVKRGAGETREEEEVELSEGQLTALWGLTEGQRVQKRRHYVPEDGATIEVDVYEAELEGLVTAEVEFESEQDSQAFEPPDWFGDELTGDTRYSNQSLATKGLVLAGAAKGNA